MPASFQYVARPCDNPARRNLHWRVAAKNASHSMASESRRLRRFVLSGFSGPLPTDIQKRLKGVLGYDGWTIIEEHERQHGWTMPRPPDVHGFWQAIQQAAEEKMWKDRASVTTIWARPDRSQDDGASRILGARRHVP